ncbi:hypothetical protein FGG08_001919 [Glutinoglossum americanum]|uniref:Uncharacterized protein n=1 Tax=Glutinoglossum americanum TaxID=1670608 RepID=A0A9P8KZN0_9PEZI|nr:hypothetical protein FGG08_001919 [Glutinoglossum americanum]
MPNQLNYNDFQNVGSDMITIRSASTSRDFPSFSDNRRLKTIPDARIQKRPLIHPPISSPHSGRDTQKVVYISSSTHFISAVKRVRKLLDAIEKRETGNFDLSGKGKDKTKISQTGRKRKGEPEEVSLKATAKAIEKALNLAIFFQGQKDCRVRIRTGSVGVVDDIIEVERPMMQGEGSKTADSRQEPSLKRKRSESSSEGNNIGANQVMVGPTSDMEPNDAGIENEELPETQIRKTMPEWIPRLFGELSIHTTLTHDQLAGPLLTAIPKAKQPGQSVTLPL